MNNCNQHFNMPNHLLLFMAAAIFLTSLFSQPLFAEAVSKTEQQDIAGFTRSEVNYTIPNVSVVRQDGKKLSFIKELDDGRPVMLNFIFASCAAICPMLSHMFAKVQTELMNNGQKIHLISVSIDPENDTPARLTEYAKNLNAGPNWDHYTGTQEASIAIQKAFNAYRGDKMNHAPLTFMRSAPGQSWIRLEGFLIPATLIREYVGLSAANKH